MCTIPQESFFIILASFYCVLACSRSLVAWFLSCASLGIVAVFHLISMGPAIPIWVNVTTVLFRFNGIRCHLFCTRQGRNCSNKHAILLNEELILESNRGHLFGEICQSSFVTDGGGGQMAESISELIL